MPTKRADINISNYGNAYGAKYDYRRNYSLKSARIIFGNDQRFLMNLSAMRYKLNYSILCSIRNYLGLIIDTRVYDAIMLIISMIGIVMNIIIRSIVNMYDDYVLNRPSAAKRMKSRPSLIMRRATYTSCFGNGLYKIFKCATYLSSI